MISRIFYPIGQGAFYAERHKGFNVVYDCGEWKNSKKAEKLVKQSFSADEDIDILFISHFDYDHINKVGTLRDRVRKIKHVVLPVLHANEKNLLINLLSIVDETYVELVRTPEQYFGEGTRIIYVNSSKDGTEPDDNGLNLTDLIPDRTTEIASGTRLLANINSKTNYTWVYVPYNHEYKARGTKLISEMSSAGYDVEQMKNDPQYALQQITNVKSRKLIRKIYDKLQGRINQNSMLVYSGPISGTSSELYDYFHYGSIRSERYFHPRPLRIDGRTGCIYCGDSDLNKIDLKNVYNLYWENVGTIQIPHHGDIKSFNISPFIDDEIVCPISVGTNNSYGHPSYTVIADLLREGCHVALVTEEFNSELIQTIRNI